MQKKKVKLRCYKNQSMIQLTYLRHYSSSTSFYPIIQENSTLYSMILNDVLNVSKEVYLRFHSQNNYHSFKTLDRQITKISYSFSLLQAYSAGIFHLEPLATSRHRVTFCRHITDFNTVLAVTFIIQRRSRRVK